MNWASERAVRLTSGAKCQINFNKGHFVLGLKRELSPAENCVPWCMADPGSCLAMFRVPGCWVLLTDLSCTSQVWDQKGCSHPSRLAITTGALLYPPLPNRARAAPQDLTNPLLFQGPRVLAVLLIPCASFFLWLLTLGWIGLHVPGDLLQSSLPGTHSADLP